MPSFQRLLAAGMTVLLVSACSNSRYCLGEKEYQRAESRPAIHSVDGLKLPESPTALRIPPAPANPVPFGVENAQGDGVCLDKPPTMPAPQRRSNSTSG